MSRGKWLRLTAREKGLCHDENDASAVSRPRLRCRGNGLEDEAQAEELAQ
jgi:hypothetical protein